MTKLFNDPARFTEDMLVGFLDANARYVSGVPGGVVRAHNTRPGKVAVVIGGGSGHYPAFCGTVGPGFADGAVVGNIFTRIKQNDMGPYTWLVGLIWFLIVCLWILDMPTGPNQCYHCDASEKLYLTFFSPSEDSGLIDGQGRFVGTWPFAAFVGYGIGARIALKKKA